mmetsp:Transcript_18937/g.28137  ORF Transcript_18937/g.28137 Transcript_18937/m.28137 type:complete len:435 (-) Transcript_18937:65-1369(-)
MSTNTHPAANAPIIMEGWLRKRSSRVSGSKFWSDRYFVLRETSLCYYLRKSDVEVKGQMQLVRGCTVSPIVTDERKSRSKKQAQQQAQQQDGINYNSGLDEGYRSDFNNATPTRSTSTNSNNNTPHNNNSSSSRREKMYLIKITWPTNNSNSNSNDTTSNNNTNTNTNTSNSTATADANSSSTCNNSIGMDNEHDSGSNSDVCSSNNNNPNNPNAINTASESLVVPNGLEMALQPNPEARVITLADPPYSIVSVNEGFVRLAKYTQLDAEGKTIDDLLSTSSKVEVNVNVNSNNKNNMPPPDSNCNTSPSSSLNVSSKQALTLSSALLSRGDSTHPCTTTLLHTDKKGKSFANFISSYPLTNAANQVTHLLHVCRELRGMHMDSHNAYSSNTLGLHAALPTLPHAHAHGNHNQHDNALAGENGSVSVYSGSGGS